MTCQDSFHEVAFNISFWTRNISSARILFWRGVFQFKTTLATIRVVFNLVVVTGLWMERQEMHGICKKSGESRQGKRQETEIEINISISISLCGNI